MNPVQRIVLCGDSVFLMAIDASLIALPQVETTRINPYIPDLVSRIKAQQPDLIVMEKGKDNNEILLGLSQANIPLVLLDTGERNFNILNRPQVKATGLVELLQAITQYGPQLD